MDEGNHVEADDTDELLSTDGETEVVTKFEVSLPAFPRDHCDLLLDAIDAQLSRLQTCSNSQVNGENSKMERVLGSVYPDKSESLSKDTGLGTDKANSTPDGSNVELSKVEPSRGRMELVEWQEKVHECDRLGTGTSLHTERAGEAGNSRREQCLWRLERLLGTNTGVIGKEGVDEDDSVHTEDFSARFFSEMLEPTKLIAVDAVQDSCGPDSASISSNTTRLTEPQTVQNTAQNPSGLSFKFSTKHLAGVPLKNFDLVPIDSDLDSVCTERVRHHLRRTLNNKLAKKEFMQNESSSKPSIKNTQQNQVQTFSSDDEGEVNAESVRRYRAHRAQVSVQRKDKRNHKKRNNTSTSSTIYTDNRDKPDNRVKKEFSNMEFSAIELQQQKVATMQEVQKLKEEVKQVQKEQHTLNRSVTQTRTHNQLLRNELHKLQAQRDSYAQEVRTLQEGQAALQRHSCPCHHDTSPNRSRTSSCVSVLEREEMDRLLNSTKSELFSEQRKFRQTLDSMRERLEEGSQELEQKEEESRKLREKCSLLEEKLATATKNRDEFQKFVQNERLEQESRVGALERIVAQKEMLLMTVQKEKSQLESEIMAVREEHGTKLTAVLAHAQKQKEVEVERLRTEMMQNHTDALQQIKEQEAKRLQQSLEHQKEALRKKEEELRGEIQEQLKRAVQREKVKLEEQKTESLKEQRVKLEKQMLEVERRGRADLERERRGALALQNKIVELQKKVEGLESAALVQTSMLRALNDEHQTEVLKLRRQLQQEAESDAVHHKERIKHLEQELQGLKATLADCEHLQQVAAARHEQQNVGWAQDMHTECVYLHELLTHSSVSVDTKQLSHSVTVSEAVQVLQSLRKPLHHLISTLQNRITSLKTANQQLSADKERELHVQREQFTAEKEKTVNALKERLIQEHIEELSSLSRLRLHEEDDGGGVAAGLRRQLQAKDEELRQVQRNMGQWKEKTTARLARKFEQELTSELERWKVDWLRRRKVSSTRSDQQRRQEQLELEMRHLTGSYGEITDTPASSAHPHVSNLPRTPSGHDLASYNLLRHLQSRIRQLQADAQSHTPAHTPSTVRLKQGGRDTELAGSYLETIAPVLKS
ncbi:trichohyalin isoform X2 [Trichomycterus rosablanca]|uniref:trichohyalin isoform X2 n=1 Tax=Trichomycterus rosablanca TaxID=2290929 RepID=UPI002F35EDF0